MSRIGNRVLTIPAGVEVNVDGNKITVKGPKGTLEYVFKKSNVNVNVEDGKITEAEYKTLTSTPSQREAAHSGPTANPYL